MMNIINVLFAVICFFTEILAATKQTEYVHLKDLDNKICNAGDKVFTMTFVAPIICLAKCTSDTNCKSVFYKSSDRHCTGCDSYYTDASALVNDSGTAYYVPLDGDPACNKPARYFRLCDGTVAGQAHPLKGRVEIFYNQTWWSVCDDCWMSDTYCVNINPVNNLNTICRTFGLSGGVIYVKDHFGTNTKDTLIDDVACTKTEHTILNCLHIGTPNAHNCVHGEAVGVVCN